jgi:signal transduction histidine kinase
MRRAVTDRLRTGWRALLRRSGPPPKPTVRGQVFDVALALGLALIAIRAGGGDEPQRPYRVEMPGPGLPPPRPPEAVWPPFLPIEPDRSEGTILLLLLVVAPLVLRRRYPLAVLWTVLSIAPAVSENHPVLRLSFYAVVIAGYTAAVYSPYRIPALASLPLAALGYAQMQSDGTPTVSADSVPFLILVPIAVAADGLRRWKSHADAGRARMSAMEHEQIEALRRATEHERARIARELHDVVTHNVSVMVIQAGAARKIMDASPDQAREALLAVEASGRSAMTELRQVMGLLTTDGDEDGPDLAPQPGLDRLEALVQRMRAAGVPVELSVTGQRGALPSGIELTVYRLVQEALTNTVKHASGAAVRVLVAYHGDRLEVEVTDTGGPPGASAGSGAGRGLIGLRERLAVYGGTLQAGPRISGGFRVHARIPVEAS